MLRCLKLGVVTSVVTLTSCSYIYGDNGIIHNRDKDYLKATSTPPLRIPPGLSSSTIEAHYPVSEKTFPESVKRVNLTPPELDKPFVMPDLRPVRGTQPNIASETAKPQADALPPQHVPNNYYDPYTRASSSSKAGMPLGEILQKIWPWGSKTSNTPSQPQPTTHTATANQSSGFFSSLWPWGKKSAAPTAQQQTTQQAENNASNEPPQKSTMPAMYYDRYTQRG